MRLWWLRLLAWPAEVLWADFAAWRDDVRFRINLTGQVRVLEGYLNKRYDPARWRIRIVSFEDGLLWVGLETEGDNYHPRLGPRAGAGPCVAVPLEGELRGSLGDVDFVVYIPAGADAALVCAEVEHYRLAGMTFKIIQAKI